jgi:hypothetical protein
MIGFSGIIIETETWLFMTLFMRQILNDCGHNFSYIRRKKLWNEFSSQLCLLFPIQTHFMVEVPGWGFALFYSASAVNYIASAILVKVSRRAEHLSVATVISTGMILSRQIPAHKQSNTLTLPTCTSHHTTRRTDLGGNPSFQTRLSSVAL